MNNPETARQFAEAMSHNETSDVDATVRVAIHSLARVFANLAHARHQVTDLQAHNSKLEERARAAEKSAREAGGGAPSTSFAVIADLGQQRDEARRERDEARAALATEVEAGKQFAAYLTKVLDVGSAGLESIGLAAKRVVRERDDLRDANRNLLANFRTENERRAAAESECAEARELLDKTLATTLLLDVPPELARLYKAAQGARGKWGTKAQVMKLGEECGEFIVETAREDARYQVDLVRHEIHDVLTVALSLCEPALMAKAAERLEGRLA